MNSAAVCVPTAGDIGGTALKKDTNDRQTESDGATKID